MARAKKTVRLPMKAVIQAEVTGCGIASVATIAGVPYAVAKQTANRLGIFAQDKRLWSETWHVRRLLDHYGHRAVADEMPFTSWESLPDLALLAIKWHVEKNRPFWHWVVFVRDANGAYVLDSKKALRNHRRTDFGRMKPKWYIEIENKARNLTADRARIANHDLEPVIVTQTKVGNF